MKASLAAMPFAEAGKVWLESRKPYLAESSYSDYQHYIHRLSLFFSEVTLPRIDGEMVRAYQKMRMARAGSSIINHECSVLQQMLKRIGHWPLPGGYQPLRLPKESPGRCIEDWEQERYFRMAAANPAWEVAYCAARIMAGTGIGPGELRQVRIKDLNQEEHALRILFGAKNAQRERWVPCTVHTWEAVEKLLRRAKELGSIEPEHFLLPFRVKTGQYDPGRPSKGWRTADEEICAAAGLKFRRYDWRHTAATRLLENPKVSTETAIAILGHVSEKMVRRVYNHTRYQAMMKALETLDKKAPASVRLPDRRIRRKQ